MNILLSLKPKYAEAIFSGKKRYEFRRSIFRSKDVEKAYIYATAPVSKIVGYFTIGEILIGTPEKIWEKCKKYAGICAQDFFAYYSNCTKAFAIKVKQALNFLNKPVDPYSKIPNFKPPQSFYYTKNDYGAGTNAMAELFRKFFARSQALCAQQK